MDDQCDTTVRLHGESEERCAKNLARRDQKKEPRWVSGIWVGRDEGADAQSKTSVRRT